MQTRHSPFALFDNASFPNSPALLFTNPVELIEASSSAGVPKALARLDELIRDGALVAGYFAYELGYCIEPRLHKRLPEGHGKLLRFQRFDAKQSLDGRAKTRWLLERTSGALNAVGAAPDFQPDSYVEHFELIRDRIGAGDVYQVNLTMRLSLEKPDDLFGTYRALRDRARAGACCLLHFEDEDVLSLSPEKFFTVKGGRISVRPMKGTVPRRPDSVSDQRQIEALRSDPKQRAENLMIVDLMRNDISRICLPGTVQVDDLFTVETYPTFHTLTSGVSGQLASDAQFSTLLPALFPCGSVTGAPKIRAMEIIREVEDSPRGVYCGAIGYASGDAMAFNVAIRTISVRSEGAVLGVGGGIVWDSEPAAELDECRLKARFFTDASEPFRLLETMRWSDAGGFHLLERHMKRLGQSCAYFGYVFDAGSVRGHLEHLVAGKTGVLRVRLTLGIHGDTQIQLEPMMLPDPLPAWTYSIATSAVNSGDWRLYHKTTRRDLYEKVKAEASRDGAVDEVILFNERGELTEGSRTNLFVVRYDEWLTPPLSCGLLDGCLRRELLEKGPQRVTERILTAQDLDGAEVWFGNSLRGLVRGISVALPEAPRSDIDPSRPDGASDVA